MTTTNAHPSPTGARGRQRRAARVLLPVLLAGAGAFAMPATVLAHGGLDVAEGGGGGVRILVQGSAIGPDQVDLATTMNGNGTGQGSRVTYWVRPQGRTRAIRIRTDRDAGGTHHAEIPTTGRGSWQDWDVSAYVTLSTGRRLRVTTDRQDPPGPPARAAPTATPTTSTAAVAPTPAATDPEPLEDLSGQSDGTPGWVIPSIVLLAVAGLLAVVIRNRRLTDSD